MKQRLEKMLPGGDAAKRDRIILWILILLHTAALFVLADFSRKPISYPDEIVYYDTAKAIYDGTELRVHEMASSYINLAYPLLLSPLMGITDTVLRVRAIALLNSFLMSLILWPVWKICVDMGIRRKTAWAVTAVFAVWPDLVTAGTFMSENLYWTTAAFAIWASLRAFSGGKRGWAAVSGVCCYLAYLSKEIGICFPLAGFVMWFADPFFEALAKKKNGENKQGFFRCWIRGIDWKSIGLFCVSCAGMYLLINKWILGSVGNTYTSALNSGAFSDPYNAVYLVYNMLSYLCAACTAFFILPVIVPVFHYSDMQKPARRGYLFGMILLLGMAVSVSWTIGMLEDLGKEQIRVHLRYFAPIIIALLPAFAALLTDDDLMEASVRNRRSGLVWVCIALYMAVHCLLMKVPVQGAVSEHLGLGVFRLLDSRFGNLTGGMDNDLPFYPGLLIANALYAGLLFIGWLVFRNGKTRRFSAACFLLAAFCLCSVNTYWGVSQLRLHYAASESMRDEMASINDYFQEDGRKEANVLYVCDSWISEDPKLYDMYLDAGREYVTTWDDINKIRYTSEGGELSLSDTEFFDSVYRTPFKADRIDYLIEKKDDTELSDFIEGLEEVEIPELSGMFTVYRNTDPSNLAVASGRKGMNKLVTVEFRSNEEYNAPVYVWSGISATPESQYSWTDGTLLDVEIPLKTDSESVVIVVNVFDTYHGAQRCTVDAEGEEVLSTTLSGTGQLEFSVPVTNGTAAFTISLPDAASPSSFGESRDSRVVALAISQIDVYEKDGE